MTIEQLIKELQEALAKHGNVQVRQEMDGKRQVVVGVMKDPKKTAILIV